MKEPAPSPKTTEETVVPKIEEQKEAEPVEKKTTILSGSFTDISIPHKKGLDLSAGRFKELEEKLKKLRRF